MLELMEVILQSLQLDASLWTELRDNPEAARFRFAIMVVLLAGLSDGIAQSVVLFLNQVRPRRFVFSLLISGIIFVTGFFFYLISIDLVARYMFQAERRSSIVVSLALAYAPLILSFLTMIPYFGRAVAAYLNIYHFLALIVATSVSYALMPRQALLSVTTGWLLLTLAKATIGRPVIALARWTRTHIAGTELERNIDSLESLFQKDET